MTDTTDIKALREKYTLVLKDLTNRLAECNRLNYCGDELSAFAAFSSTVTDQLEAERQRADKSGERFYKAVQYGAKLEAELAALKGDQVPVAEIKFYPSTDKRPCMYWFGKQDRDFPVGTQFFTAPQKPVVLSFEQWLESKGDNPVGWVREAMKEAYDAAIEAAGGKVAAMEPPTT